MQFLKDAIPRVANVALLTDSDLSYRQVEWQALALAARSLNVMLRRFVVRQTNELERAFAAIETDRPDALFLTPTLFNFVHRKPIIEFATKSRLPTMAPFREYPESGGLMSYGNVRADRFRRAAVYVAKILKGAKPADLPVEQPVKYELVINLKTARFLDLEISRDLLLVADEVVE